MIRGLPKDQAQEAFRLSCRLGDEELFTLMACLHFGKSSALRVFSIRDLVDRPSVSRDLQSRGIDPLDVVRTLIQNGFMVSAGRGRVCLSREGQIIEHRFGILRDHLMLATNSPALGRRLADMPLLKEEMRRISETDRLESEI